MRMLFLVHGDGTDSDLLDEERFGEYDACISYRYRWKYIILSMYANKLGIKNYYKINGVSLFNVLELVGLQSVTQK